MSKYILHLDMDAFFASIEQRDDKNLLGKPVIIGADPKRGRGRGVVSTCSYQARAYGVHSAMPISTAYRLCPQAAYLRPDMEKYSNVSRQLYQIFHDFTPVVEMISIDEAFLDITSTFHIFGGPVETAKAIKRRIKEITNLSCSIGLAPVKLAAKIASDLKKPDGLVWVGENEVKSFLAPLPVEKMWGVGAKAKEALNKTGVYTIGQLAEVEAARLYEVFGKNGFHLSRLANGLDERVVNTQSDEVKSISSEITFEEDSFDEEKILSYLLRLSEKVSWRLRDQCLKGRTITLKIRLSGFTTHTCSVTISGATSFADVIYKNIKRMFLDFDRKSKGVRLIGVKVSGLVDLQLRDWLFDDDALLKKNERLHRALELINGKFGDKTICRARLLT
jgi:DNA polymerase IV